MSKRPLEASRTCQFCKKVIGTGAAEIGWECECGAAVCTDAECYEECFKTVAGGEGVRCRTCGHVT